MTFTLKQLSGVLEHEMPLWSGTCSIVHEDQLISGEARITLESSRVSFLGIEFSSKQHIGLKNSAENVQVSIDGMLIDVVIDSITSYADGRTWFHGRIKSDFDIVNKKCSLIKAQLLNFKNFFGKFGPRGVIDSLCTSDCVCMEYKDLRMTVISSDKTNEIYSSIIKTGKYGCTHKVILTKKRPYGKNTDNMLESIDCFLSFCQGYHCNLVMPRLIDREGKECFIYNNMSGDGGFSTLSWTDKHHPESIAMLFPLFMEKWEDRIWHHPLKVAIYWYLRANNALSGIDSGIVLSQIALELLSYTLAVNDRKLISKHGFERLSASDKLRMLNCYANIELIKKMFISEYPIVAKYMKNNKMNNFLDILPSLRNRIVHNDNTKPNEYIGLNACIWRLSLWYLEMAILGICNYGGKYSNRLTAKWEGQVEAVPWKS